MFHKAKKHLGQNFLKSKEALFEMCKVSDLTESDVILEIGPGKGALTEKLLERVQKVFAVEKDSDLIQILNDKFPNEIKSKRLVLLNEDILLFDPSAYDISDYKIVANIPYNITGSIIRRFLSEVKRPTSMTLLVQKEVAERIIAKNGKESILSLSVKAYGNPKYVMKVGKRFFNPSPKVDSAIVHISSISNGFMGGKEEESFFFQLIKAGFAHKRKVISKNLESLEISSTKIGDTLKKLSIDPKTRAEDIPFLKWKELNCIFLRK